MDVEIEYCTMWNYEPQASRLEEELKSNFTDVNVKMIKSKGGTFKVTVNGKDVVFDKLSMPMDFSSPNSLFPKENEITEKINNLWKNHRLFTPNNLTKILSLIYFKGMYN